jgi:nucleotide-binding universal stress UspA family protein
MRILVAIDDSKSLEELLRVVIMQIRTQDSEVRILHVLQPISVSTPPQMARRFTPEIEEQRKQAQELIDTATKQIASAGFKVDSVIDKGDVKETILDSAIQWHADLIVVGSHGSGGVRRFLLGSVAEAVARHAPYSVEIVRIHGGCHEGINF